MMTNLDKALNALAAYAAAGFPKRPMQKFVVPEPSEEEKQRMREFNAAYRDAEMRRVFPELYDCDG